MDWNPALYGAEAATLLALAGDGRRLMPLVLPPGKPLPDGRGSVETALRRPAREIFPDAVQPELALAGLWLYCGYFDESHTIAQDVPTADGSYWHAILLRMEPDAWNAGYWFRRVGQHPVFAELHAAAVALGYTTGPRWDPLAFVDACTQAAPAEQFLLQQVQLAEWQILFHYCAKAE